MKNLFAGLLLLAVAPAFAQNAVLLREDSLRTEPFADAKAVAKVAAGAAARVVERKGSWSLVESDGKKGWVRGLNLKIEGAAKQKAEGVLALETGRQAKGGVAVPLAIRAVPMYGPAATLMGELFDKRDASRTVKLAATPMKDGTLRLELQSPRQGYAYVFMAAARGDALQALFPNAAQPDNDLRAGRKLALPGRGWRVQPPEGKVSLLAIVTDAPLDLALPDKLADGPLFRVSVSDQNRGEIAAALGSGAYGAGTLEFDPKQ
jgi:uncharacterized protein YgiM (DUF1202 family)